MRPVLKATRGKWQPPIETDPTASAPKRRFFEVTLEVLEGH